MAKDTSELGLGHIAEKALNLLRKHPEGLTMSQMREMLNAPAENQEHFNRRVRDIRKMYILDVERIDGELVYKLGDRKPILPPDLGQISEKLRAEVMHAAHGRCQMCGKTISEDKIKLQADHKIPSSWGGKTDRENLWAICEECNRGKRNFFSSFDEDEMREVLSQDSVHKRIAHFLKLHLNEAVPSYAIEFIANAVDQQEDWQKRLRELRTPGIDLEIEVTKKKKPGGGIQSYYTLKNWRDLPADPRRAIREHERNQKNSDD